MWLVGILTSLAACYVFRGQGLYASFGLNVYYFLISFWGLYQWRRDKGRLRDCVTDEKDAADEVIHLNRMPVRVKIAALLLFVPATLAVAYAMKPMGNPMPHLDAGVTILSATATYFLSKSYIEQWKLWVLADLASTLLCALQGMWWMTALYLAYAMSAVYGYYHWKKKGIYVG